MKSSKTESFNKNNYYSIISDIFYINAVIKYMQLEIQQVNSDLLNEQCHHFAAHIPSLALMFNNVHFNRFCMCEILY